MRSLFLLAVVVFALGSCRRPEPSGVAAAPAPAEGATVVAASPAAPAPAWIDDATLVDAGVTPWTGLPLWLPPGEPDSGGFMTMDCARAQRAGLEIRPLADTVVDTAAWLAARDNAGAWKHVLSADVERLLVNRSA